MLEAITVLSVCLVWILLISLLARTLLPNRFLANPRLGLVAWFLALTSSLIAGVIAIAALIVGYLTTSSTLSIAQFASPEWMLSFALSFLPWIALATFGVLLVLLNLKVEAPVVSGRKLHKDLNLAKQPLRTFQGVQISVIELPIHYAHASGREILISSHTLNSFSGEELEAVLWHELGHIRGHHRLLKSIARLVSVLTRPMNLSRVFRESVDALCEVSADNYASSRMSREVVDRVRDQIQESA